MMADLLARCAVYARPCPTISSCLMKNSSRRCHPIVSILGPHRPHKLSNAKYGHVPNPRQQKFRAMNGAHLASPIMGELSYAHWPQLGSQIHCPIGNQIWGPLGKQDVCPNFALTVGKFVFSNSGNFKAKANPPKPR